MRNMKILFTCYYYIFIEKFVFPASSILIIARAQSLIIFFCIIKMRGNAFILVIYLESFILCNEIS